MIWRKEENFFKKHEEQNVYEIRGLSSETKPTSIYGENIAEGSSFFEYDTFGMYFYDGIAWVTVN